MRGMVTQHDLSLFFTGFSCDFVLKPRLARKRQANAGFLPGVGACLKHVVCGAPQYYDRMTFWSQGSMNDLRNNHNTNNRVVGAVGLSGVGTFTGHHPKKDQVCLKFQMHPLKALVRGAYKVGCQG